MCCLLANSSPACLLAGNTSSLPWVHILHNMLMPNGMLCCAVM